AGRIETVVGEQADSGETPLTAQFMVYSTYWAQAGKLKSMQSVRITGVGPDYRPVGETVAAKVLSFKNRGLYGSGVNDVQLQLQKDADAAWLRDRQFAVLRMIPE